MAFIRGIRFFLGLTVICAVGVLVSSYPGDIELKWLGYAISLPMGFFIVSLFIMLVIFHSAINTWDWLWNLPSNYLKNLDKKRTYRANNLLLDGLSAIAAGQNQEAKEIIEVASELLPDNHLVRFVAAQASYVTGDEELAVKHNLSMLKDRHTAFLGLKGLITYAKNKEDYSSAQEYIDKAVQLRPDSPWLHGEYLSNSMFLAQKGTFPQSDKEKVAKYISKQQWTRHKALISWFKLQKNPLISATEKEKIHIKIFELAPDLTINVQNLVEYYLASHAYSKAQKILLDAFKHHPHRILGALWDSVFHEMEPVDRYRTMEKLVANHINHPESLVSLATSAMKAQLWGQAKEHIDQLLVHGSTRTACNLMAELMELQHPEHFDLAREWWLRASQLSVDYEWQCSHCHKSYEIWQPICNHCKNIDHIRWIQTHC